MANDPVFYRSWIRMTQKWPDPTGSVCATLVSGSQAPLVNQEVKLDFPPTDIQDTQLRGMQALLPHGRFLDQITKKA